jgi:hypothetical protein
LDLATAAVTITQLLGLYRQEKGARQDLTHKEFIQWLEYHRHEELKELITHTFHLSSEVDQLLRADHDTIIKKLDTANKTLADILTHVAGLGSIATTLIPNVGLSEDAIEILMAFASSGVKLMIPAPDGSARLILDGKGGIADLDPRFFDDDLNSLVAHGLITLDQHMKFRCYQLTRRGVQVANLISQSKNSAAAGAT